MYEVFSKLFDNLEKWENPTNMILDYNYVLSQWINKDLGPF